MSYFPMTATGKTLVAAADAAAVRTAAGVGTIATQDADDVSITGGSLSGISGVFNDEPLTVTSDTTLDGAANVIMAFTGGGAVTLTLPAATGSGTRYDIKRSGPSGVTIARTGDDTIDGASSNISLTDLESVTLVDTGADKWTRH